MAGFGLNEGNDSAIRRFSGERSELAETSFYRTFLDDTASSRFSGDSPLPSRPPGQQDTGAKADRDSSSEWRLADIFTFSEKTPASSGHSMAGSEAKTLSASSVTHDVEVVGSELLGATAGYASTTEVDRVYAAATRGWVTQSFPETDAAGLIDKTSGFLQNGVDRALQGLGAGIGLSAGEATISAGICTNFILAPITGPLGEASTFIEIAGLVAGLAMGPHGLVLACIKPLLHSQLEHLVSKGLVNLVGGSHPDDSTSDAHTLVMRDLQRGVENQLAVPHRAGTESLIHQPEQQGVVRSVQHPVPSDAPVTSRETTRSDPLWLCLGFAPKQEPHASSDALATGIGRTAELPHDVSNAAVLAAGDDEFLRTLPSALRVSSVSEVDLATAKTMSDLTEGRHFILRMEGAGVSMFSGKNDPQAAYLHPGCLTGACVPPDRPSCLCPCIVCRSLCGYRVPRL